MTTATATSVPALSLGTVIQNDINAIVAKAAAFVAGVENAEKLAAEEVVKFFQWLAGETPAITAGVQNAINLVNQVKAAGVPIPSSVTSDIADLNTAVAALNAAAAATNAATASGASSEQTIEQTVTATYAAIQNASSATSNVAAAAVQAAASVAAAQPAPAPTGA